MQPGYRACIALGTTCSMTVRLAHLSKFESSAAMQSAGKKVRYVARAMATIACDYMCMVANAYQ